MTDRVENELECDLTQIESQLQSALVDLFGTPDNPRWPATLSADPLTEGLVSQPMMERAAGPFGRGFDDVEKGLYRKHCTQCHGITGDGFGPAAALLSPYPRDFRRGTFKFKSTAQGERPTLDDLVRTIEYGIAGTSMPGMANLKRDSHYADDIAVLAHYVRYLAIRGEVERTLMLQVVPQLDLDNESLYEPSLANSSPERWTQQQAELERVVISVARKWAQAKPAVIEPGLVPDHASGFSDWSVEKQTAFIESSRRGKVVFASGTAGCSSCHGENGDGQGKIRDFDEWTKDWTIRAGIDPRDKAQWRPLKKLGLLKPVPVPPRNLPWGAFRKGNDPASIFHTIVHGIEGTPMPAAARAVTVKQGLSDSDLWDLINYCQAMSSPELLQRVAEMEPSHGS